MDSTKTSPLGELYRAHQRQALRVAERVLRHRADAEDAVQEVFSRLCERGARFDGRSREGTWLHRVVVNGSINVYRARERTARLSANADGPSAMTAPAEHVDAREAARRIHAALARLPRNYREVLRLRELDGLSYPEIARVLGVPEGTVKSLLHRARARLTEVLTRPTSDRRTDPPSRGTSR